MLLLDGQHSAGFLSDLGVNIEDINFFEGKECYYRVLLLSVELCMSAKLE